MKKINKFLFALPFTTLAATPIVCSVSCGQDKQETINMVSLLGEEDGKYYPKQYEPSFHSLKPTEVGDLTQVEATQHYIEHMQQNPDDFIEDMLYLSYSFAGSCWSTVNPNYRLVVCEFGFSKPTFGKTNVWEFGFEDTPYNTVSFKEKVHLVYEIVNELTKVKTKQEVTVEINYSNIIFGCYEFIHSGQVSTLDGWSIGFLDKSVGNEAFWMHRYNSEPWSISYSCVFEQTDVLPGGEGKPDVEIKQNKYYSGLIDNADKLFNLVQYQESIEPHKDEFNIEYVLVDILLFNTSLSSHYFADINTGEKVGNKPDVCVTEQLWAKIAPGDSTLEIHGINFIRSFVGGDIGKIKLSTKDDINLKECSDEDRVIKISSGSELIKRDPDSDELYISAQLRTPYTRALDTYRSFIFNRKYLEVDIEWPGHEAVHTTLYLHYNTIKVFVEED